MKEFNSKAETLLKEKEYLKRLEEEAERTASKVQKTRISIQRQEETILKMLNEETEEKAATILLSKGTFLFLAEVLPYSGGKSKLRIIKSGRY